MAIGVNWKEIWAPVWAPVWQNTPPVAVPDVVGQSEASGTAEIQGDGFVVAVVTAYSAVVAAGDIISQVPAAGTLALAGSTVTITVSLGEAPAPPAPSTDQPAGGNAFFNDFELVHIRRQHRKRKERERKANEAEIEDEISKKVAHVLYQQEAKDAEREDLSRIQKLADTLMKKKTALPRPVLASVIKAHEERTFNALQQLERVVAQTLEEEEALIVVLSLLDE